MSHGGDIQESLKFWLDENLPKFLLSVNEQLETNDKWTMPAIEDYCLVVAVRDFSDGGGGVFTITDAKVPTYRIQGLISAALDI